MGTEGFFFPCFFFASSEGWALRKKMPYFAKRIVLWDNLVVCLFLLPGIFFFLNQRHNTATALKVYYLVLSLKRFRRIRMGAQPKAVALVGLSNCGVPRRLESVRLSRFYVPKRLDPNTKRLKNKQTKQTNNNNNNNNNHNNNNNNNSNNNNNNPK